MHEMSLCEGIRTIVVDQAAAQNFSRVKILRLELGRFACVEKKAMDFAFDVVMRGSPAEGAVLEYIDVSAMANCFDCGKTVEVQSRIDPCPECGSGKVMAISGEEMRIKDMEVE